MNKKFVFMVFTLVFLVLAMVGAQFIMPAAADPVVIRVPENYSTIQEAINAANPGDVVQVASGTYYYEHLTIDKSLTLIGEDRNSTIIDGNGTDAVIRITASNVSISGFTVQKSGNSSFSDSGIFIEPGSNGNNVSGNIITSNANGILTWNGSGSTISNNQISNNRAGEPGLVWGSGIYLLYSSNNTVSGNTITNNLEGVLIQHSSNNTISNNVMSNNLGQDFVLSDSQGNIISNNLITSLPAGDGVALYTSRNNAVMDNMIFGKVQGVRIDSSSSGNTVVGNIIRGGEATIDGKIWRSERGVMLDHSSHNNTIVGNTISNNNFGIVLDYVRNNTIYHNNFMDNTVQVHHIDTPIFSNTWDNRAGEGNYWSDYEGVDLDGDGIGDTLLPHAEVDYHPLIIPWGPIPIVLDETIYPVALLSNSTVSAFKFNQPQKQISFNVNGPLGTIGFCNVTIPKTLLRANETHPWQVLLDGNPINYAKAENATHTSLYFTYTHSTRHIQIIGTWVTPEFPTALILPLLIITALLATILRKMTHSTKKPHNYANSKRSD